MKTNLQIDRMEKKILSLLLDNARISFLDIARSCNVSGAAIHQRIQKLKEEEEYDTKEAFLQMLQNSKPTRLTYVEVD